MSEFNSWKSWRQK